MHEMAIASALVDQVLRVAREHQAERVREVVVVCGVVHQVVPEALELAFEAVTAGTTAEGATLRIEMQGVVARCRECGLQYEATVDDFGCPTCMAADPELLRGQDIILQSVVCDVEDENAA